MEERSDFGVTKVWMHRSFGPKECIGRALQFYQENNISVIAGATNSQTCVIIAGEAIKMATRKAIFI